MWGKQYAAGRRLSGPETAKELREKLASVSAIPVDTDAKAAQVAVQYRQYGEHLAPFIANLKEPASLHYALRDYDVLVSMIEKSQQLDDVRLIQIYNSKIAQELHKYRSLLRERAGEIDGKIEEIRSTLK